MAAPRLLITLLALGLAGWFQGCRHADEDAGPASGSGGGATTVGAGGSDGAGGAAPPESLWRPPLPYDEELMTDVRVKGETFRVVAALEEDVRVRGLAGWPEIPARGGMLFVFPDAQLRYFVMRDCLTDIDIAYLNAGGQVLSMHTMINEPRRPGERDQDYEDRLTRYSSGAAVTFALEVAPGTLRELGVRPGDVLQFDVGGLKRRTK